MRTAAVLLALGMVLPVRALACGGFFCNNELPVDQTGEVVVFGIDEGAGEVTVNVQISYAGPSESFAWVVPVPAVPELFVTSDALFSAVDSFTTPRFQLVYTSSGLCDFAVATRDEDFAESADTGAVADTDDGGVTVVAEAAVGPYQTVTLQATSSAELLEWLQANDYDLPGDLEPVLSPYVAGGQYFVALKLAKGNDTGDLAPLGMTYPGTGASIPIQLTSIAAAPDMPLRVYVFGQARAVPDNYLHLTINDAAVDWFTGGSNYRDVISLAADEAGGHGFVTDYAGTTSTLRGSLRVPTAAQLADLRGAVNAFDWVDRLLSLGLPPTSALLDVLLEVIPFPSELASQGVTPQNFYDCLGCWPEHVSDTFDPDAATTVLDTKLIAGMRAAEELFAAYDHVTRLTSSLDADEMTTDPFFVYNRDLPQEVSNVRTATLTYQCGLGEGFDGAEKVLTLADGRRIRLPSDRYVREQGTTDFEQVGDLRLPAAILIEDYGSDGLGEVVFDWREEAADEARRHTRAGCGCDTGTAAGGSIGLLSLLLLAGGRRRR